MTNVGAPAVHRKTSPATFAPAVVHRRRPAFGRRMGSEDVPPGWAPPPPPPPAETGQMTCGCCQRLLSYPRGSRHVQCGCCYTVNLVLEAHEVGNVKCDNCSVLLMYPYGAPAVKCSSCNSVTKIGEHNIRPPLSVQQGPPPLSQTLEVENSDDKNLNVGRRLFFILQDSQ